jgi:hypothetical protein
MHQQTVAPFGLHTRVSIDAHNFSKARCSQSLAEPYQSPIDRRLLNPKIGNTRAWHLVLPGFRPEPSTFERVDIEAIDNQDVVEGFLQAGEEARANRFELGLSEALAGAQQTMVRPGVVVGERTIGLNDVGGHPRSPFVERTGKYANACLEAR